MMELQRSVRFCISLAEPQPAAQPARHNAYAAWPSMIGLGVFYQLDVRCCGEPDPITGYLINIATIDEAVRREAIPIIERPLRGRTHREPAFLLREIVGRLEPVLDAPLRLVTWHLTPHYRLTLEVAAMDRVLISQQFDFAASHRLHCPELDEEANRRAFGKCNSAHGHGHNYRLQVTIAVPLPPAEGPLPLTLQSLERIVDEQVIERFDHRHLNLDTEEFARLNPSVEHITKVCHDLLAGPLAEAGGELTSLTVWETEKTCCTYPAAGV